MAFTNGYLLYRYFNKAATHEQYMIELQASLLGIVGDHRMDMEGKEEAAVHKHEQMAPGYFHKHQPRCLWCSGYVGTQDAHRTWFYCLECKAPLCDPTKRPCFANYHNEEKMAANNRSSKTM